MWFRFYYCVFLILTHKTDAYCLICSSTIVCGRRCKRSIRPGRYGQAVGRSVICVINSCFRMSIFFILIFFFIMNKRKLCRGKLKYQNGEKREPKYFIFQESHLYLLMLVLQLPGVDPNDPSVKDLLASMQNQPDVRSITVYWSLNNFNHSPKGCG